ncbi:Long chain fatty acid CoA ligase, putative [Giardia lamblia P15]|uniref:Long chain fatty acid CoA ligase, putative n=1 Tax=Giardia intestinalis (strain P15) TaxID=658858 RepID=E1F5L0_GIAIA|nr:Long chain fatty acid CoA ligase, putative [Giardia lamblia P15]
MSEPRKPELINGEYHIYECPITTQSHLPVQEDAETDTTKTILQNVRATMKRYPNEPYLGYRAGLATCVKEVSDKYTYMTYGEADSYVTELAKVLTKLGIGKGDRVGIFARNSPLWLLFDFACTAVGAVVVPIYDTLGAAKTSYCINHAEVRLLVTQTELLPLVLGVWPSCPSLQRVVLLDMTISSLEDIKLGSQLRKAVQFYAEVEKLTDAELGINSNSFYKAKKTFHFLLDSHSSTGDAASNLSDNTDLRMKTANVSEENAAVAAVLERLLQCLELQSCTDEALNSATTDKLLFLPCELSSVQALDYAGDCPLSMNDLHTILYTSGTSGNPKGVVHTQQTILAGYCMGRAFFPYRISHITGRITTILSYLPLGHIYEREIEHYCSIRGCKIAYYAGNTKNLTTDIKLAKPTILLAVPRVLQKIYNAVMAKVEASLVKKAVFCLACKVKEYTEGSWIKTGTLPWLDNIVFKDIKAALGGHLELIVSGSSALPQEVWRFMRLCTGARITCGYGLTETCLVGLRVLPHDPIEHSPAGKLVSFMQAKLIDKSDTCELSLKTHRVGELLLKGPGIAKEYYKMPESPLRDADGYFHTGDLMRLNDDGSLTFVRRINMVVKSLMGEFIDICAVEDAMEKSPLFASVFVHAQSDKSFPICVTVLDKTALAHRLKCSTDEVEKPDYTDIIKSLLANEANIFVKRAGLKGYCVPKCFRWLFDIDWSTDQELMTPSMKKQHRFFAKRYAAEIASMWEELQSFDRQNSK